MNELQRISIELAELTTRVSNLEKAANKKPPKHKPGAAEIEAKTVGDPPPDPNQLSLPVVKQGVPGGNSIIP